MADPFTGLAYPQRIESAELTYKEGLPIQQNLDWLTVTTAPQIDVPEDAWVDWDAKEQKWITAAEKFPEGTTANVKSVVTYPADLFDTIKWHDGSPISVGDFVMAMIQGFDPAKPESPIYDESLALSINAGLEAFKGYRITSTDPLTIEAYSDSYNSDAELNILTLWPYLPLVSRVRTAGKSLPFRIWQKQTRNLPTLRIKPMHCKLNRPVGLVDPASKSCPSIWIRPASESYIPYEPTLGQYITKEEADLRYANLKKWYEEHGHFWVGTGPYYLDKVFTTEKTAVLKNNPDFPDLANRWAHVQRAETCRDCSGWTGAGQGGRRSCL